MTSPTTWFLHTNSTLVIQKTLLQAHLLPSCCGWAPVGQDGTAGQSLSEHEVKKRVTGCDQDADAHVELKIVDEEVLGMCKATRTNNNTVVPQYLWGFESRNFLNPGVLNPSMDTKLPGCSRPLYKIVSALHIHRFTSNCTLEVPTTYHKLLSVHPKKGEKYKL